MKRIKLSALSLVSFFCLHATLTLSGCKDGTPDQPYLNQLALDFRKANQANEIGPMLALYHTEQSDTYSINLLKGALQYELGLPIASITFEPLTGAAEETIAFTHNGTQYGPTLRPELRMRVVYDTKDKFTSLFTIGKSDAETWKIVSVRPINDRAHDSSH